MVFLWRSKRTFFCVWIEVKSVFVAGQRNRFGIRVGIEVDSLISDGVEIELVFECEIEIDLILLWE